MTQSDVLPPRTHNLPPTVAPTPEEFLDALKSDNSKLSTKRAEFLESLKDFPDEIRDDDVARSLQDLLGQVSDQKDVIEATRKRVKKPWDGIVKAVQNFFVSELDELGKIETLWRPRLQHYKDERDARIKREQEAEAERLRLQAIEAQRQAAERAMDALYADALVELAEFDEAAARRREEEARERQRLAEAAAEHAREEERRVSAEKREREKVEKARNVESLRSIKDYMKIAERLNALSESEEISDEEAKELDRLVQTGGAVGNLASPVANSMLLDDDQKTAIEAVRKRLGEMRLAINARLDAKVQKKRAKAEAEERKRQTDLAAQRAREAAEHERQLAEARAAREAEEARAEAARQETKDAKGSVTDARAAGRDANAGHREASKDAKIAGEDATRLTKRSDKMDRRVETATAAPLRGDFSTGSTSGRYKQHITDEAALRAACGPLGPHFTADALDGAVYQFMAARRQGFTADRVVPADLPGVEFVWDDELRIA